MTIDDAITIFHGFECNPLFSEKHFKAFDMAITSLEAWGKIKKEIEHKKFRTMEVQISDAHLGFNGGLECALAIIDKHLQEVEE